MQLPHVLLGSNEDALEVDALQEHGVSTIINCASACCLANEV